MKSRRKRKPQEVEPPQKVIPLLGIFFFLLSIPPLLIESGIPWFGGVCEAISEFSFWLAITCLVYTLWIYRTHIKMFLASINKADQSKKLNLSIVETFWMKEFLQQTGLTVMDTTNSRYDLIPQVCQTKQGFRIEVIGNLRQILLADRTVQSLESFLHSHGYDVIIQSAQYRSSGWVYYHVISGIKSDRMRF